jgi:hypothetical protein
VIKDLVADLSLFTRSTLPFGRGCSRKHPRHPMGSVSSQVPIRSRSIGLRRAFSVRAVPPVAPATGGTVIATWAPRRCWRRTVGSLIRATRPRANDWMRSRTHSACIDATRS